MIKSAKRLPVLRYGLIVSIVIILSSSAFYLYFHYTKAVAVRYNFSKLIQARSNTNLIDSCIVDLFMADNNSRMYALTKDETYFHKFSKEIEFVSSAIYKIDNNRSSHAAITHQYVDGLLVQKTRRIKNYFKVLAFTDSLLKNGKKINEIVHKNESAEFKSLLIHKIADKIKKDTISSKIPVKLPEKKFFSRVFSAMSKKKSTEQDKINYSKSIVALQQKLDSIIRHTAFTNEALLENNKKYQDLVQASNSFKNNELELITINNQLINRIVNDLNTYKLDEQKYIANSNILLEENLQKVVYNYKTISGLVFALLTALVIVVLYNIWKLFKNDKDLIVYSETAALSASAKGAFLASMSHEIRTPLSSVIGFSEQLMEGELSAAQSEQVRAINSSSSMLLAIVNEILDFSKYETGKMKFDTAAFSPHTAICDVLVSLGLIVQKKGLILQHELALDETLQVTGDPIKLKQVILNLLNNAIKFTHEGTVLLKAWTTDLHNGLITLHIQIKDSGIGISKENLESIFDEFSQVESAQKKTGQKGTGLGLAICKKIIELQGGQISVSSENGIGSTFSFQLTYELSDSAVKESTVSKPAENKLFNTLAGRHFLVADDNELNILLVSTILKKWGITYDTALDGLEAISLFDNNNYDVILTDIEMPNMGGVELARNIRKSGHKNALIPIVALTANVMKKDTDHYMQAGMNGIISKPFSERDFMNEVIKVFAGSSSVKPSQCADR